MKPAPEFRQVGSVEAPVVPPALVVDLEGTLVKSNLLLESVLALLRQKPYFIFHLLVWLLRGTAYTRQQIACWDSLDVAVLPYRSDLLDYLKAQRATGRPLVLVTADDTPVARQVAEHLKLFDLVLTSDGTTVLSGECKRRRLVAEFGEKGFDYAANDRSGPAVWSSARKAIVVGSNPLAGSRFARAVEVDKVFEDRRKTLGDYLKALRPQHWLKNLLVFVPLLAAHRGNEIDLLAKALLGFLSFGCFASAGYLLNDLLDLPADRRHPLKRFRPFAAGDLPLSYGFATIPVLFAFGWLIGALVSLNFLGVALTYFALTLAYSLRVKRTVLLDVIVLAGLYTMRIMAGCTAVAIWPSHWLLAFSMFLFFSLALVKRYGELVIMRKIDGDGAKARGFELSDGELVCAMGVASGYLAVLVLALYISSDAVRVLYARHEMLWFLCPLLLYWISHVWLTSHRGRMPDDPVLFAIHDPISRILMLLMVAVTALAL